MRNAALALLYAALTLAGTAPAAQTTDGNFGTIRLAVATALPVNDPYGERWTAGPGVRVGGSTEFYGGIASSGLTALNYNNPEGEWPDFVSLQGDLGWAFPASLGRRLTVSAGGRLGAFYLIFGDHPLTIEGNRTEIELGAGLEARADVALSTRLGGYLAVDWTRMFTREHVSVTSVHAGVTLTFDSPTWLRAFLQ